MVYIILALFQAALYKTWSEEVSKLSEAKHGVRPSHSHNHCYIILTHRFATRLVAA
jgi:hypothetical protein